MQNFSNKRRVIEARSIYNLESRNIRMFMKEVRDMQSKIKNRQQKPTRKDSEEITKKYDENELKELQFDQFKKVSRYDRMKT